MIVTYHVDDKINEKINRGDLCIRSYDDVYVEESGGDWITPTLSKEEKDADTAYYQWVPFMLVMHGLIFLIPANLWNFFEDGLLEQFGTRKSISATLEEEEIRKLAEQNARRFKSLSRRRNNRYFLQYLLCEMGNILVLIVNF